MYQLDHTPNAVFSLHYHLIVVVKYRRKVFGDEKIVSALKQLVDRIAQNMGVTILEQGVDQDHVHILFRAKPTLLITKFVNAVKTNTSRMLKKQFGLQFRNTLRGNHFWSPSYFLATTGNVTVDLIRRYVEHQGVRKIRNDQAT